MSKFSIFHFLSLQIDEDLTAKLNMGDVKFSFHEKHREYNPAWISPESEFTWL